MPGRYLYKKLIRRILHINDTPEAIALGTALGVFLAMTPTIGIQMLLVIIFGTMIGANRLAGIVMVYISNPFTMIPIYWFDYWLGSRILGVQSITREAFEATLQGSIDHLKALELWAAFKALAVVNFQVLLPTTIGGVVVGLLLAVPAYPITLRAVRAAQRLRAHKLALKNMREARKLEQSASRPRKEEEEGRPREKVIG